MHATLVEGATAVISKSDQPMSAAEVRFRTEKFLGRRIDLPNLANLLDQLVAAGKLSARTETLAERAIRAGGSATRGRCGKLYFAGKSVPARTKHFSDIKLGDGKATSESERRSKSKYAKKQARRRKAGSGKRAVQTGSKKSTDTVALVKAMADERDALVKRVAQLEETLARINRMFVTR